MIKIDVESYTVFIDFIDNGLTVKSEVRFSVISLPAIGDTIISKQNDGLVYGEVRKRQFDYFGDKPTVRVFVKVLQME